VNERLRRAIRDADLDIDDVARATGASHRTVERWITKGRIPQRRYRIPASKLLNVDESDLWPGVAPPTAGTSTNEIVAVYSRRASVPADMWRRLVAGGRDQIDLLGSSLLHLFEDPGFVELLWSVPCEVRIVLADPRSAMVEQRDEELRLGGTLAGRIRTSIHHLRHRSVKQFHGHRAELRLHTVPVYSSLLRVDDEMLVTPNAYGQPGRDAPVLHLRRREPIGIFESFQQHSRMSSRPLAPSFPPHKRRPPRANRTNSAATI
jgi:hypothetical protein